MVRSGKRRIAILCYPGAAPGTIFSLRELLAAAAVVEESTNLAIDFVGIGNATQCTFDGGVTTKLNALSTRYDATFIPPMRVRSVREAEERIARDHELTEQVRKLHRRSKITLGACSGVALLAKAGILDNRKATACWWLEHWLRERFPQVELDTSRMVTKSEDVWTAGAGIAYMHMALELLSHWYGAPVASSISRLMLLDRSPGSQSPYALPTTYPSADDPLVDNAIRRIAELVHAPLSVAALGNEMGVSVRTLNRRFKASLGTAPLEAIHQAKLSHAKSLLETSDDPFDAITAKCGYADPATFHKLFSRLVGISPSAYRERFAAPRY